MNVSNTINACPTVETTTDLLGLIAKIHESVGEGLNDDEFTRFLEKRSLPVEAGFSFLSFCNRFVTLTVPEQDCTTWHAKKGWIPAEKETVARSIAKKYDLSLCEPPDAVYSLCNSAKPPHHLEFVDRHEAIVVAHPQYLKIRMFAMMNSGSYTRLAPRSSTLKPHLLQDLAALYSA